MVVKFMGNTGGTNEACAMMYKVVVQAVLLYGSKSVGVTDEILMVIEGFCHRITRQILGMIERKSDNG